MGPPGALTYGTWQKQAVAVAFDPAPKRIVGPRCGGYARLGIRSLDGAISTPYAPGRVSPQAKARREAEAMMLEQPDG